MVVVPLAPGSLACCVWAGWAASWLEPFTKRPVLAELFGTPSDVEYESHADECLAQRERSARETGPHAIGVGYAIGF
jgi:hypothetical protein